MLSPLDSIVMDDTLSSLKDIDCELSSLIGRAQLPPAVVTDRRVDEIKYLRRHVDGLRAALRESVREKTQLRSEIQKFRNNRPNRPLQPSVDVFREIDELISNLSKFL